MTATPSKTRFRQRSCAPTGVTGLVTFPSYEPRFLESLKRATSQIELKRVSLILFREYDVQSEFAQDVDREVAEALRRNYELALEFIGAQGIEVNTIESSIDDLACFVTTVKCIDWKNSALDISTMPRSHILLALRFALPAIDYMLYTQGSDRSQTEESFAIGVRDILTLPGYEGEMGHRPTLLVICVGFEAARAYSLFRRFEPTLTLAVVGDPGADDAERDQLLATVKNNNGPLFNTDGVFVSILPSYDPEAFCEAVATHVDVLTSRLRTAQKLPVDVVLSPVGTKPQALGLYSLWSANPNYQIAYAVPTTRRVGTAKAGPTMWFQRAQP